MNIKLITQMMIDSGIEKNEAQKEIEIILKHFFNYTEIDKIWSIKRGL